MLGKQSLPSLAVILAAFFLYRHLAQDHLAQELSLSLGFGLFAGLVLQRSRFCFYCVSRDFLEKRNASGLLGILTALAVGTLGYHAIFGAFMPTPIEGRLPPGAHIGPVSIALVIGGLAFGFGMAVAGSCISAQLYRLGEGALTAPLALLGTVIGFVLGLLTWNTVYLRFMQDAPVIWLPHHLGYAGSLIVQLLLIGGLAVILVRFHQPSQTQSSELTSVSSTWWCSRWPTYVGGILLGALGTIAFLRIAPLGVTAELGSLARTLANHQGWLPSRLEGIDTFRGCATAVKASLWSNNGVFVIGLVLASLASALLWGDFKPKWPSRNEVLRSLLGGILMGWGATLALGCTVGTLLSGIMAAALSGWVFLGSAGGGLVAGWLSRKHWPSST